MEENMNDELDRNEPSEELIQHVAATMSSMDEEERDRFAKLLHITPEELGTVIKNWKTSRQ
jgi:hypothetical protein